MDIFSRKFFVHLLRGSQQCFQFLLHVLDEAVDGVIAGQVEAVENGLNHNATRVRGFEELDEGPRGGLRLAAGRPDALERPEVFPAKQQD